MSKELRIGIISVIIIAIFFWGYNFLKGENVFEANSRYFFIEYPNIQGLNEASIVTINGLKVGKVESIIFNTKDIEKRGSLKVKISLNTDFEFSKKSIAKIYSPSPISGSNLAIVPNYEGEIAVSGDFLMGEIEAGLFDSVGERLNPLQEKIERVIVSADSLFLGINQILNKQTRKSLTHTIQGLEYTLSDVRKTINSVNKLLDSSSVDIKKTIRSTKNITENLSKVSDTLVNANIGEMMKKVNGTLTSVNGLLKGIENGEGSLGKFVNDDAMYNNLTNASKELEELLREMKLNPKRFVHFSLFGKKAKEYNPEKNKNNKTNK